jgi:hypothetical protein
VWSQTGDVNANQFYDAFKAEFIKNFPSGYSNRFFEFSSEAELNSAVFNSDYKSKSATSYCLAVVLNDIRIKTGVNESNT